MILTALCDCDCCQGALLLHYRGMPKAVLTRPSIVCSFMILMSYTVRHAIFIFLLSLGTF